MLGPRCLDDLLNVLDNTLIAFDLFDVRGFHNLAGAHRLIASRDFLTEFHVKQSLLLFEL